MNETPLLIAGLGNPGESYARHRHNVGFMAVDAIAARHKFSPWRPRYHGLMAEGALGGRKTLLLKPMTYMNESGRAVGEAMRYLKLPLSHLVAIHDELDLAPGKLRTKTGGGDAGHNGLRSITASLGPDYRRMRIGIGHPGAPAVLSYVLHDFSKADREWLVPLLDAVAEAAPYLAADDDAGFMNRVALLTKPPKPPKPKPDKTKDQPADGI
ncbi:MAG TPA: aminoacyl-tRNA hydrolase [Micropepsaceae bacterium]|jgi:PTH1 family peptidyl-tRNA hydrolase|nr:aminoacyl-tRNA hydrolase [Micropepsaceae bacterium]